MNRKLFVAAIALFAFLFVACTEDPQQDPSPDINTPIHIDPEPEDGPAVDLGLSVLWRNCNLGASKPEEVGDFYSWGALEPCYETLDPLVWKDYAPDGFFWNSNPFFPTYNAVSKYCPVGVPSYWAGPDSPEPDNILILEPEDDAAFVQLGDTWHIPTRDDWTELINNCEWEWTTIEEVGGYQITGPSGKSIFLPAGGAFNTYMLEDPGKLGGYWTSNVDSELPDQASKFHFYPTYYFLAYTFRYAGNNIRPVADKVE